MLRKLILKNREIPITVPVLTLGDAIQWVEESFLRKEAILTSAVLDDKELINELYRKSIKEIRLNNTMRLQIKIETPKNLSNQSLDVVCDLAYGIANRIRKMGVDSWQGYASKPVGDLEEAHSDVQLLLELLAHINGLAEEAHSKLIPINKLGQEIDMENLKFANFLASENWPDLANLLGKVLEPYLRDLAREGERLQIHILNDSGSVIPSGSRDLLQGQQ